MALLFVQVKGALSLLFRFSSGWHPDRPAARLPGCPAAQPPNPQPPCRPTAGLSHKVRQSEKRLLGADLLPATKSLDVELACWLQV